MCLRVLLLLEQLEKSIASLLDIRRNGIEIDHVS